MNYSKKIIRINYNYTNFYINQIETNTYLTILYSDNKYYIKSAVYIKDENNDLYRIRLTIKNIFCNNSDNNILLLLLQQPTKSNTFDPTFNKIIDKCNNIWNQYKYIHIFYVVSKLSNYLDNIFNINSTIHEYILSLLKELKYNNAFIACGQHIIFTNYFLDIYNILTSRNLPIENNSYLKNIY
jgi:hypothetical protein